MSDEKLLETFRQCLSRYSCTVQHQNEDGDWDLLYSESQASLALLDAQKELAEAEGNK